MKCFYFIYNCFVSDEPFAGWFNEIATAAIQLVFLNAAMFAITVVFGQPLVIYIGLVSVTTLYAICKTKRWFSTLGEASLRKATQKMSEITFAQALTNPEMAKDLIAGYKLKPTDPGGREYITQILDGDLSFLNEIGSVSKDWAIWVGWYLAKKDLNNWRRANRFIEFSLTMNWETALAILNDPQIRPLEYHENTRLGLHHTHVGVTEFWKTVEAIKFHYCEKQPGDCFRILTSEPKQEPREGYLLSIIQKNQACAKAIAEFKPEIAAAAARIAPEHALEIARMLPGKAIEIAVAVPQAFR